MPPNDALAALHAAEVAAGSDPLRPVELAASGTLAGLDEAHILRMHNRDPFTASLLGRARDAVRNRRPGTPVLLRSAGDDEPPASAGWFGPDGRPHRGPMRYGQPGRSRAA